MWNSFTLLMLVFLTGLGVERALPVSEQPASTRTMGEESFGNDPLPTGNYEPWPGLSHVINDERRVYQQWVNGSEFGCYVGDADAINELLKKYSEVTCEKHQLVLRPGPGIEPTFDADKTVEFDCKVYFFGGIAGHMATRDKGDLVWNTWPIISIHVSDRIDLQQLELPENVEVLQLDDLKKNYLQGLESTDQTVRGWSCGRLASLDKFDFEIMAQIAAMLEDENDWVQLNALSSLPTFGAKVEQGMVKGQIEALLESENTKLKEQAQKALAKINDAKEDLDAEQALENCEQEIREFCAKLKDDQ